MAKNYRLNNYKIIAEGFKEENIEKALKYYIKAYNSPGGNKDPEILLELGLIYQEKGALAEAKEMFTNLIDIEPNEPSGYYGLAICYGDAKDYPKAIKYYKKATELDPYYYQAHFFLANAYDEIGNKDKAIKHY